MATKISGIETTTEAITLLAVPYVDHGTERTYLYDFKTEKGLSNYYIYK